MSVSNYGHDTFRLLRWLAVTALVVWSGWSILLVWMLYKLVTAAAGIAT